MAEAASGEPANEGRPASNPESINRDPELLTRFDICSHCNCCLEVCEQQAIRVDSQSVRGVDRSRCAGCLTCVETCPSGALGSAGKTVTVLEALEVVLQDRPFYDNSGGGVTLSGGEPLMQPGFARALLQECRRRGLHTVLDTSGHASTAVMQDLLPYLDLVLFDIKHADPQLHARATGADNRLILDNLRAINGRVDIWLRVPVIPGFNDDEQAVSAILTLAREVAYNKLCFLPYHRWGVGKYSRLGREYNPPPVESVPEETLQTIRELADGSGLRDVEISREA